jgi:glutamate 5-kinase
MDLNALVQAQRARLAQLLLTREDLAMETAANEAEIARLKALIGHNVALLRAASSAPAAPPASE